MKTIKEIINYLDIDFEIALSFDGLIDKNTLFGLYSITLIDSDVDLTFVLDNKVIEILEDKAVKQIFG